MTDIKPVSRTGLSEQVALQIAGLISAGEWKPGEKLPSEAELCKAFQISRPSLREALKSLAFAGLVDMRSGQGTFVAQGPSRFLDRICAHGLLTSRESVADLTTARIALEGELAALCAQRATAEEVAQLESLVARILECRDDEEFLELDLQFHLAIAAFSKNEILAQFLRAIRNLLQEVIRKSAQLPNDRQITYDQHLKVAKAIAEHNARKARAAMRRHLRTFQAIHDLLAAPAPPAKAAAK